MNKFSSSLIEVVISYPIKFSNGCGETSEIINRKDGYINELAAYLKTRYGNT
jgi:hypothetical protein